MYTYSYVCIYVCIYIYTRSPPPLLQTLSSLMDEAQSLFDKHATPVCKASLLIAVHS